VTPSSWDVIIFSLPHKENVIEFQKGGSGPPGPPPSGSASDVRWSRTCLCHVPMSQIVHENRSLQYILFLEVVTWCWFFIYGFTFRSRILHLYGNVTIAGEGLQNLGLCSALGAFEQGGIFIVPHQLWHGTLFFSGLIGRTAPFSRILGHTRGCGGCILTRILTVFNVTWMFLSVKVGDTKTR
jgi:hypothetical protein